MKKYSSNRIIVLFILIFCVCTEIYAAETIRMNIGENTTLHPSDLSSKTLAGQPSWTSSRPDDVVVESVTMYSCTIKAKKSFSGYALVQCVYYYRELDPYDPDHIHQRKGNINYHVFVSEQNPTSITVYPADIVMDFGSTKQMSVTVSPSTANQTVTWTTTDRTVATVNDANILGANGYGTAIVTATTSNGLSASCKVNVPQSKVEPTNISLPSNMELKKGVSATLTPTLTPTNAFSTYSWESSDTSIVSVSSEGKIKGIKQGTATITVTTANNLSAKCKITVTDSSVENQERSINIAVRRINMLIEKSKEYLSL